ncbi:protein-L-isoaspartate (D-aspartate) O-methyltransferase [Aureococcus anophagefferens]|nr:protein-L-isoaspartate (D-aspartate) O-methyltransferase [Aureococcus anophagefferens]
MSSMLHALAAEARTALFGPPAAHYEPPRPPDGGPPDDDGDSNAGGSSADEFFEGDDDRSETSDSDASEAARMAEEEVLFGSRFPDSPARFAGDLGGGAIATAGWRRVRRVDRALFVPQRVLACAYDDAPLRSRDDDGSCVVHVSAPSIYAAAAEALDLRPRLSFLNAGSGSGYFSALAAELLGPDAVHHCVERCPALAARCRRVLRASFESTCGRVVVHGASCFAVDAARSMRFDRIYVGAGARARDVPFFAELLKPGGVLVGAGQESSSGPSAPPPEDARSRRPQSLLKIVKTTCGRLDVEEVLPVQFTPLHRGDDPGPQLALRGPVWGRDDAAVFPPAFRAAAGTLARSGAALLPAHVWDTHVLACLPYGGRGRRRPTSRRTAPGDDGGASDSDASDDAACDYCGAADARGRCGRCKTALLLASASAAWPDHKADCEPA